MNIELVAGSALRNEQIEAWSAIQRAAAELNSPFFRPEYVAHVAAVQPGVEVAIVRRGGAGVAFFPFQRVRANIAQPVGGILCDFQGIVAGNDTVVSPIELLRECGLAAWHFHHAMVSPPRFERFCYRVGPSRFLDLSRGFDAYHAERRQTGSQLIRKTQQKARKAQREVGPLRFEPFVGDQRLFDQLIAWKRAQYARCGAIDFLAADSTLALLDRLWQSKDRALRGALSAVYLNDRPVALHLGLLSFGTLHAWFPAYDPEWDAYSPGMLLFLKLAEHATEMGVTRIDLGQGSERFKEELGSEAVMVAEGSVDLRRLAGPLRHRAFQAVRWLQSSWLRKPARLAAQWTPGLRRWATFH